MNTTLSRASSRAAEVAVLAIFLVILGWVLVPAHRTSIWMDEEFTGFVAPISNHMADGMVLYADGGHLPIPPLSLVFFHLVSADEATWFEGSVWNYLFQCAALLVLYVTLTLLLRPPIPFLAVLCTLPIFLAIEKTVLYDSFSQFLVASVMAATVYALGFRTTAAGTLKAGGGILAGCLTAALLLSKQSTGMGVVLGALFVFVTFPRQQPWRARLRQTGMFLLSGAGCFLLLCLLLTPYMSVQGMIVDVFLTGSQPKGGPRRMLFNLLQYAKQVAATWPLYVVGALALLSYARFRTKTPYLTWRVTPLISVAAAGGLLLAGVVSFAPFPNLEQWAHVVRDRLLWTGFGLLVLTMAGAFVRLPWRLSDTPEEAIAVLGFIALPAAVFHSLSAASFRWTYDNNPLIALTLAVAIAYILTLVPPLSIGRFLPPALIVITVAVCCLRVDWIVTVALKCTEPWPEVKHLAGAKLRPESSGMREVVAQVREAASGPSDSVLLLPNDPNVEEWFERPSPPLAGPMVFTDQYWDRYVDQDLAVLKRDPPKVIIIGPRRYWPWFTGQWHPGWGAQRLISRIRRELLPKRYRLLSETQIGFQRRTDHMDIYVLAGADE